MRHRTSLLVLLVAILAGVSCTPADGDADGDRIADADEGRADGIDTDGDGQPDFLDLDSDGDGVSDRDEAGDDDPLTPPVDADDDGVFDARDLDSDDNGLGDDREGDGDTDGDGILDRRDRDDDGDRVSDAIELRGRWVFPSDADGDGAPDFRDRDSDDDTILDGDDGYIDSDGDGRDDVFDLDTDDDGIPDADEAGDDDLETLPIDTDDDGIYDFRDGDADGDGLPDGTEREEGTDPLVADSDDDGVSDLIEVGAGTDPNDGSVSPLTRGDFVFVMPFRAPAEPARSRLLFRTDVAYADVYFQFDTTSSMSGELAAMREAVQGILDGLTCRDSGVPCTNDVACAAGEVCSPERTCIADPRVSGCIASLWTGVGVYAGVPDSYRNLLSLQRDSAETRRRIPTSASGAGGEESLFQSVACVADPSACSGADCVAGGIGCPAFRSDAIRLLVTITDEPNQCATCGVSTAADAAARLSEADVLFVGVDADAAGSPEAHLRELARRSGSIDAAGVPYYAAGTEGSVTTAITDAILAIAETRPLFVSVEQSDEDGDAGDALQFIDHLEVDVSNTGGCTPIASVADTDGDGRDDAFPNLLPGTPVCWEIVARDNDRVEVRGRPQVFRARITVRGDDSVLDARTVYFLVPPVIDPPLLD